MNNYGITFDIDWAPDFAIEKAALPLIKNKIKCTWFITHLSPYIKKLFEHPDIFEFGIHPNFFQDSTHGKTKYEVLKHICSIVPGSKIVRSHDLYQSSRLISTMINDFGIEIDCNLLLYLTPNILPHKIFFNNNSKGILRIPFFWEDDIAMYSSNTIWDIRSKVYHSDGLKIFNFHPIHVYLNSDSTHSYEKLKTIKILSDLQEKETASYINNKKSVGTEVFFNDLIKYLVENEIAAYTLSEIKDIYELSIE